MDLSSLFHLKVAKLTPGASFAAHFDTDQSTGRAMSLCLWLNDGWEPDAGGKLRVFPFPFNQVSSLCQHIGRLRVADRPTDPE